jgi:hypothetical protein
MGEEIAEKSLRALAIRVRNFSVEAVGRRRNNRLCPWCCVVYLAACNPWIDRATRHVLRQKKSDHHHVRYQHCGSKHRPHLLSCRHPQKSRENKACAQILHECVNTIRNHHTTSQNRKIPHRARIFEEK